MFKYPKFNKNGVKVVCSMDGEGQEMLMDIKVFKLKKGDQKKFKIKGKELALLLTEGEVRFSIPSYNMVAIGKRGNVFDDLPTAVHVCKNTEVLVICLKDCEFIYQSTTNDLEFKPKIYRPKDIIHQVGGENVLEGTMLRDINTVFDKTNAPYSNMVLGEVLTRQGRWCSYVPHYHPQPEVYYYKFEREEAFGACFINEEVSYVKDGSCCYIPGGKTHVQATAPGFRMYYAWMIRHLDNDPWLATRIVDERYKWLEEGSYGERK